MSTRLLFCEGCRVTTLQRLVRSESVDGKAWKCLDCLAVHGSRQTTLDAATGDQS